MTTWESLHAELVTALRHVTDRTFVIISSRDAERAYVQYACDEATLSAEASGSFPMTPAADTALTEAGWVRPSSSQPNWTFALDVPAMSAELDALAHRSIVALRDAYRVASADALHYQAWRDPEPVADGTAFIPEEWDDLDKGENPLVITALTIPYQS